MPLRLKDITELYRIEKQATQLALTHEQRSYFRHGKAKPVLKRLQYKFKSLERDVPLFGKLRETGAGRIWFDMRRSATATCTSIRMRSSAASAQDQAPSAPLRTCHESDQPRLIVRAPAQAHRQAPRKTGRNAGTACEALTPHPYLTAYRMKINRISGRLTIQCVLSARGNAVFTSATCRPSADHSTW